jgi:ADP-ribosylglycohydrolase
VLIDVPLRDRFRGALLGLAAGDALGGTLEFRPPGSFEPIEDMVGGGPFALEPGQWTDDTSMALCLAESLVERRTFDPGDQLERYLRWYREGRLSSTGECFDVGGTTREAIETFERTRAPYCGSSDPSRAGNGSIMRLAPVPMFFFRDSREAIARSGDSSRTTHGAAAAVDACRLLGALIAGARRGERKEELLGLGYGPDSECWRAQPLHPEIAEIADGSYRRFGPPRIAGTGHVVRSLEAALWAFHGSASFREGCLRAVNLGDDADSTGAVFGQLAGAYWGENGIPSEWRARLALRQTIESLADRLHTLATHTRSDP